MASPTPSDYIIDFGDEEEGGGRVKVKDGTYKVRVLSAATTKSANKGTPGLAVTFGFAEGTLAKQKKKITETLWLTPKAYKRIRLLMEALDLDVPKSKLNVAKLVPQLKGGKLYIEITTEKGNDDYPDKSVVAFEGFINPDDYDPEAELDEEDLDEDTDDAEDEDDDDSGDSDEAEDDDDADEDADDGDEEEEPEPAPKKKKAPAKKRAAKKSKAVDEDDEDLDLDLDDF